MRYSHQLLCTFFENIFNLFGRNNIGKKHHRNSFSGKKLIHHSFSAFTYWMMVCCNRSQMVRFLLGQEFHACKFSIVQMGFRLFVLYDIIRGRHISNNYCGKHLFYPILAMKSYNSHSGTSLALNNSCHIDVHKDSTIHCRTVQHNKLRK